MCVIYAYGIYSTSYHNWEVNSTVRVYTTLTMQQAAYGLSYVRIGIFLPVESQKCELSSQRKLYKLTSLRSEEPYIFVAPIEVSFFPLYVLLVYYAVRVGGLRF